MGLHSSAEIFQYLKSSRPESYYKILENSSKKWISTNTRNFDFLIEHLKLTILNFELDFMI